jgi:cytochrome c-type biogenesis protein CcmH/NrfF
LAFALFCGTSARAENLSKTEHRVLERLFSPCCYRETLDVHASPIAEELRAEIHQRVQQREDPEAILADMVRRFGPDVLTRPVRTITAASIFVAAALVPLVLLLVILRKRPRSDGDTVRRPIVPYRDPELEDRLADELASLD